MNERALRKLFNEVAPQQFELGGLDCVRFVAEAVFVGWGRDYRDVLDYTDRRTAVDQLRQNGGLRAACTNALGRIWPVESLSEGDVIWFEKPVATIGLLMPMYVAVKSARQIGRVPIDERMMGWRT